MRSIVTNIQFEGIERALRSIKNVETELDHCIPEYTYSAAGSFIKDQIAYYTLCHCDDCAKTRKYEAECSKFAKKEDEEARRNNYSERERTIRLSEGLEKLDQDFRGNDAHTKQEEDHFESHRMSREKYDFERSENLDFFRDTASDMESLGEALWGKFSVEFNWLRREFLHGSKPNGSKNRASQQDFIYRLFVKPREKEVHRRMGELYKRREELLKTRSIPDPDEGGQTCKETWRKEYVRALYLKIDSEIKLAKELAEFFNWFE